jgi:putative copper resistance protein D
LIDWLIVVRAAHFASTAMTAGVLIFLALVAERAFGAAHATAAGRTFRTWTRRLAWAGLTITVISGAAWVALQAIAMSGLPFSEAIAPDVLWIVVSKTHFGIVSGIRLALAVFLAASLSLGRSARWTHWIASALAVALVATIAWTGHAAATLGSIGILHLAADALHVLASGAWVGGLPALGLLLVLARRYDDPAWAAAARDATLRFSTLGLVSVGTLLATGVVNSWFLVGSFRALVDTEYGRLLLIKIGLFAAMLSVAAFNRLLLTPRLSLPSQDGLRKRALRCLSLSSFIEMTIGLAIFAIIGALGTMHPAIHIPLELPVTGLLP